MSKKKNKWFDFFSRSDRKAKKGDERITFVVPDLESRTVASEALAKVRIPVAPQLQTLATAYVFGNLILRKLRKGRIQIVEQKGLSKEEAYKVNEQTITGLVEQRNALADVIEKMLHPVIKVVGGQAFQVNELYERLFAAETRIRELEEMIKALNGKAPIVPPLPNGKQLWTGNVKSAATKVVQDFKADSGASMPSYRSLRDASDQFFDAYEFKDKGKYTKEQFYFSVKKANDPWGKTDTKRE